MSPMRALRAAVSGAVLALSLAPATAARVVGAADGVSPPDAASHTIWLVRLAPRNDGLAADVQPAAHDERANLDDLGAWRATTDEGRAAAERLAPLVADLAADGHVAATELLPAARVLAVTGDDVARARLARAAGVLDVRANRRHRLPDERAAMPVADPRARHLARVNAPGAWRLGASGAGATVGIMDSGVDWRHPALAAGYRGRDGRHDHAWADLAGSARGSREPIDPNGHGTHVAGIAVGRDAESAWGVAPGAEWLAVRVFDGQGETSDLQLLRGAEWLLAPTDRDGRNPRPDLAPDVVNASWNLENGADPLFEPILAAWRAAGIVAVFAAGNDEDGSGSYATVRAPGSSALALSVGALDVRDGIWPLSRGGPAWDGRLKPDLVAPGVGIVSSVPGGAFAARTGTSMATPQVAGAAALVRGAAPWLGPGEVGAALLAAADDLGVAGPDPVYGHGVLDAGAAVARVLASGRVAGRVATVDGDPIVGATVRAARVGDEARTTTVAGGGYSLLLEAGSWEVTFDAPGYAAAARSITVTVGAVAVADVRLPVTPGGQVVGRLRSRDGTPLVGTVAAVRLAPIGVAASPGVATDGEGRYALSLPEGTQTVRFAAVGHRAVTETVAIAAGRVLARDVALRRAPSILLVDADAWQSERIWPYLGRALADAGYAYDVWTLDEPGARSPALSDLAPYGLVWWAHLFGSPGLLDHRRGDRAVTEGLAAYAAGGGRLLVSGQDVGAWDAENGFVTGRFAPAFYRDVLGARLVDERAGGAWALGAGEGFEGLRLRLDHPLARAKGPRLAPDAVAGVAEGAWALLEYADGTVAVLGSAGAPGRRAYASFGPESAGDRAALARFVDATVGWLEVPDVVLSGPAEGVPGGSVALALRVLAGRGGGALSVRLDVPPELAPSLPPGWQATSSGAEWRGALAADGERSWPLELRVAPSAAGRPVDVAVAVIADGRTVARKHRLAVVAPDLGSSTLVLVPASPQPDEAARAELALRNDGPAAATALARLIMPGAWLPDALPASASAGSVAWRAGTAEWRGTIAAGGVVTITANGRATGAVGSALRVRGAVTPTVGAAVTRALTATLGAPRLAIVGPLAVPVAVDAGASFTVSVPVANRGRLPADAELRIALPQGMSGGVPPAQASAVTVPVSVAAGATVTATARLWVDARASAGERTLEVGIGPAGEPPTAPVVRAAIRVQAPDLSPSTVRIAPAVPRGGQTLTITLRLVNAGTVAVDVLALDVLPPSLTVVDGAVEATGGEVERSPGLVEWRVGLPPGEVETLIMPARLSATLGPNAVVPHAWRLTTPAGTRILSDTLLADPLTLSGSTLERVLGSVRPGGRVRYRLVAAVDGAVEARDVGVRVDLPWPMNLVSADPELVRDGPRSLTWRGRLAPGARRPLAFDVRFDEGLAAGAHLPVSARLTAAGVSPFDLADDALVAPPGPIVDVAATGGMPFVAESVGLVTVIRGGARDETVALDLRVPAGLVYASGSASASAGAPPVWHEGEQRVAWLGVVPAGQFVAVGLRATSALAPGRVGTAVATLADPSGRRIDQAWADVRGAAARAWLPVVGR